MDDRNAQENRVVDDENAPRPQWQRPTFSILDVENGTITTSGPVADGNGSTS